MVGAKRLFTVTFAWLFMSVKTTGAYALEQASFVGANSSTAISAVCLQSAVGDTACLLPDLRAGPIPDSVSFEILYASAVELQKVVTCESYVFVPDKNLSSPHLRFCQVKVTLPENVDVTGKIQDSSGSVNTSAAIDPRGWDQSKDVTTLGCPCDLNRYESFCCPRGHSYTFGTNDCVEDTLTPRAHVLERSIQNYHVVFRNLFWCDDYTRVYHSADGSICLDNFAGYCLYRELNTTNYRILGCMWHGYTEESATHEDDFWVSWLYDASMGSASLIALATFIVYSLVPELKNFQGRIVRSYLASYSSCMILIVLSSPSISRSASSGLITAYVAIMMFFSVAYLLWFNVMSFDIWRTFREFRTSQAVNAKDEKRATFVRYSIYAWVTPVLTVLICEISGWISSPQLRGNLFSVVLVLIIGIFISNTYFYVSTALKIKQINKETAQMVDEASKHHQKNKQWFNLYLKLFIIMGYPIILWVLAFLGGSEINLLVVALVELLKAISMFYMFVWKKDVKKSFRKQFSGMMRRLGFCRQRDSTPGIQDGNEQL